MGEGARNWTKFITNVLKSKKLNRIFPFNPSKSRLMHLKIGDEVVVTSGNHKGQRGKVTHILREENRVAVEGVNLREELSDQVVEESGDAWPKHQVIFFATRNFPRATPSFRRPLRCTSHPPPSTR